MEYVQVLDVCLIFLFVRVPGLRGRLDEGTDDQGVVWDPEVSLVVDPLTPRGLDVCLVFLFVRVPGLRGRKRNDRELVRDPVVPFVLDHPPQRLRFSHAEASLYRCFALDKQHVPSWFN